LKTETFVNLLDNKNEIQQLETVELKTIVEEFPYFQNARALYLKGLKNLDSFKYNNELKITAAYTTDRTVLFDYITSKTFENEQKEEKAEADLETTPVSVEESPIEIIVQKEETQTEIVLKPTEIAEEKLEIGTPISFTESENFSFNQWLQLSTKKPIIRENVLKQEAKKKLSIIEKFIENNPKIAPLSKDKNVSVLVTQNKQDSSLMTETLAKVYLEQKKYENAIQAYRILSLKYPEKSGFFADQIKRVQILQKNKS
jgi:hypothetical protein